MPFAGSFVLWPLSVDAEGVTTLATGPTLFLLALGPYLDLMDSARGLTAMTQCVSRGPRARRWTAVPIDGALMTTPRFSTA